MPLIRTKNFKIGGSYFDVKIYYDAKNRLFTARGLPDDFASLSPSFYKVKGGTDAEHILTSFINLGISEYLENKRSARKVILFRASASIALIMNPTDSGFSGLKHQKFKNLKRTGSGNLRNYSFDFDFKVCEEVDKAGKKDYFNYPFDLNSFEISNIKGIWPINADDYTVVSYTDEVFNFFVSMVRGFEKMVFNAADFFALEDETAILEAAKSQNLLGQWKQKS